MSRFVRMFKPQFAALVESGKKRQTVRPVPKRIPKVGDIIDARTWMGKPYRSKQRKLREAEITQIASVEIGLSGSFMLLGGRLTSGNEQDAFARADGFSGRVEMFAWFGRTHDLPFSGIAIYW